MEIEEEWAKEKAQRQAVSTIARPRKPRGKLWLVTLIVLVVGGVITAGVIVQMQAKPTAPSTLPRTEGTVGIQIRANPAAMIRIDGHKAGKTPMTVHMQKSTRQVRIEADMGGRVQTKLIVPDQDQDVGFTR
jgi:PEGA domain-containing protein